mgnify:CR=1 FL=1
MNILISVSSLLLSTAILLIGHGMQLTILPLRATANGLSDFQIGLTASFYFLGFIVGCMYSPKLITRIGHIRVFAVLTATMGATVLCLDLTQGWLAWMFFRFLAGFAICGLYTVIESWLNSAATATTRGRILAIYTFIILGAMTLGQLLVNVGPINTSIPFTVTTLCLVLAIIPIGLTRGVAPVPVESAKPSFMLLYRRSHSAFFGAIVSGLIVGSFWALGAVFARSYGSTQTDVTWFMATAIAGGALLQYPIGHLSDRVDRRLVMIVLCAGGGLSSALVANFVNQPGFLGMLFLFGVMVMPIYAISLAIAADVSEPHEFVQIGTSILLLNAIGSMLAPLVIGQLMTHWEPAALFWSFAVIGITAAVYLLVQLRVSRKVSVEEQTPFTAAAADTAPVGFDLDPRSEEV